jgi:endonuclease/exonuclease/phosphatase family metal-dependent hydrolase
MLDVGTGSGVLAIAAALLGAGRVTALEADPLACDEARENVALSGVADRVEVVQERLRPGAPPAGAPYDGVTVNLEGADLLPLLSGLASSVRAGGWLAVAGLLAEERRAALAGAAAGGLRPVEERRHRGWWSAALGCALLAASCGGAPVPPPAVAGGDAPDGEVVRLMAYNLHHGEGNDGVLDLERLARVIDAQQPDLVALQEVDVGVRRTGGVDQATRLAQLTGMAPAFGAFMPYQGGEYGMAVLSRWPVLSVVNERLPDGAEPRTALTVRVRSPGSGQELVFVGIHFYRTEEERLAQARRLLETLETERSPVILAGDFNSTPGSPVLALLARRWWVLSKADDRLTFPSDDPRTEIDFIMLRPRERFHLRWHRVLDEPVASDHRPVVAEVVLRRQLSRSADPGP